MLSILEERFPAARESHGDFFVKTFQVSNPRAELVWIHDVFDYHAFYNDLAYTLSNHGYQVHLIDLRGFGRSAGVRGLIDRYDDVVDDIEHYLKSLKSRVILGGHSFGALAAIRLHHRQSLPPAHALKGLVLMNPMLRLLKTLPSAGEFIFQRLKDPFDLVPLPWKVSVAERISSFEKLGPLVDDPLVRNQLILRTYREIEKLMKLEQNASYMIDVPTLALFPGSDSINDIKFAKLFMKAIDHNLCEVNEYTHSKHDLVIDVDAPIITKDLLTWLDKRFCA